MSKITAFAAALIITLIASVSAEAQTYNYASIQQNYSYNDGFGINHAQVVEQKGKIEVGAAIVKIDEDTYVADEAGHFRNADGRKVKIVYGYNDHNELGAITITRAGKITEYLLDKETVATTK